MTASGDMNKNMGKMETSITDLQDELDVANKPSKNHFKPGWLVVVFVVIIIVGLGTFLVATRIVKVDTNTVILKETCELRNEQLEIINAKFNQLVNLFDVAFENRPPNQPPPTEEILKLYDIFRKPIKLQDCDNISNASVFKL